MEPLPVNTVSLNTFFLKFILVTRHQFAVFIDVDGSDTLFLNVITTTADDRAFSIKVTQLRDNLSPQGCFQYYTNSEGIIKTFNYDDYSQTVQLRRPSYFVSLFYCYATIYTLILLLLTL